jgi:putative cell wall-binding protein
VEVSDSGEVSFVSTLIDPYGIITDANTGEPISGVQVTLYYADTERNKEAGKTPGSVVELPILEDFKPNQNKNPQTSGTDGAYGFMVFPESDYYLEATKDGFVTYRSPVIPVEQDIVRWDIKMNKVSAVVTGVKRIAGLDRIDTALEIAKANYPERIKDVILARSDTYPDALTGSVLAYKINAPILLVGKSDAEQEKVLDYMKEHMDLGGTVYILGGPGAVSNEMQEKVAARGFQNITRLGGADRYGTAVKIAEQLDVLQGTPIFLAYGESFPDALSASSTAAINQTPILLVNKEISSEVREMIAKIKPIRVYIVGLQGAVSTDIENEVARIASLDQEDVIRIGGTDRYETSIAIAEYFDLQGANACFATGSNFPDALSGSIYAANFNSPIILTDQKLSDRVKAYLRSKNLSGAVIFGGEGAVSQEIEQELAQIFGK